MGSPAQNGYAIIKAHEQRAQQIEVTLDPSSGSGVIRGTQCEVPEADVVVIAFYVDDPQGQSQQYRRGSVKEFCDAARVLVQNGTAFFTRMTDSATHVLKWELVT